MRRAADRARVDQLQRPLLFDRADFCCFRSRGRIRLSDRGRVPGLGPLWTPSLRAQRNFSFPADPVRGIGLRLGKARPRMGQESTGSLRFFYALAEYAPGLCSDYQDRRAAELDAQVEHLVHAVRPCLLRDRVDAYGWPARRYRSFRRVATCVGATIRSYDRGRHADSEDGASDAPALRPDAGSEVRHLDGLVRELRRSVPA